LKISFLPEVSKGEGVSTEFIGDYTPDPTRIVIRNSVLLQAVHNISPDIMCLADPADLCPPRDSAPGDEVIFDYPP